MLRVVALSTVLSFMLATAACSVDAQSTVSATSPDSPEATTLTEQKALDEQQTTGAKQVMDAERVYRIALEQGAVVADVISTGCTLAEHFEIRQEINEAQCQLTLVRNKPDFCRRVPFVMEVRVPWDAPDDCATLSVTFGNKLVDPQTQSAPQSKQRTN